jgi:hypothetical protein
MLFQVPSLPIEREDRSPSQMLLQVGAAMHSASMRGDDQCSIAMLDTRGIVVGWFDEMQTSIGEEPRIVDQHVAQFYLPLDIAALVPQANLTSAEFAGSHSDEGWRRHASGDIYLATTHIRSLRFSNGQLCGYSHVSRPLEPRAVGLCFPKWFGISSARKAIARWHVRPAGWQLGVAA